MLALAFMGGLLAVGGSVTAGASKPRPLASRSNRRPVQVSRPCRPDAHHARARRPSTPPARMAVQLDVFNALRDGSPIFNGDFADPFALKTANALYLFASERAPR